MCDDTNWTKKKSVLTSLLSRANCCVETPRQQQREAMRWFFFFPLSNGFMAKCDWTFLAIVASAHESHISQGCPSLFRQLTHPLKNVELWRGRPDEKRNGGSLWCCGVKAEWHPRCRTHTVSRLESSNFFSLSLQRKKLLEKNPFYAWYQRVAFGLYRQSFRKRHDEDGRRFVNVVKKEEVKSSRGEGRRRWKGWTEEDDSLWGEARTERRRYFIFQRFFLQCPSSRLGLEMFLEVCRTSRILLEYRRSALT